MKNIIAYRRSNAWTVLMLILISITFMLVWLPFVRSLFDGQSYVWGTTFFGMQFSGAGVSPDFIFLIFQIGFFFLLMYSFYWVPKREIFYTLLVAWYINTFGNLLFEMAMADDVMFHGDTLNVHISLFWIVIPLSILAMFFIYKVISKDMKSENVQINWNSKNTLLLVLILGPLPIQAILFASGEPHGVTDQIGVVISIVQCFLVPMILIPRKVKSAH